MTARRVRVLVVEDHALVREAIVGLLATLEGIEIVGSASTGREAVDAHRALEPDVTLMDLQLPELSGFDAIAAILRRAPGARIIVLTTYSGEQRVFDAVERGARGYLSKSCTSEQLALAIRQVDAGGRCFPGAAAERLAAGQDAPRLTEREVAVLRHVSRGLKNKEIAALFGVSESAIKQVMLHVMKKLGAHDRTSATIAALKRGVFWMPEDP